MIRSTLTASHVVKHPFLRTSKMSKACSLHRNFFFYSDLVDIFNLDIKYILF